MEENIKDFNVDERVTVEETSSNEEAVKNPEFDKQLNDIKDKLVKDIMEILTNNEKPDAKKQNKVLKMTTNFVYKTTKRTLVITSFTLPFVFSKAITESVKKALIK